MNDLEQLETIATELIETFEITVPPIPIETMLRQPKDGMWQEIDINQLSGTFFSLKDKYSPRMSLARMLVRHIAHCEWGKQRHVSELLGQDEARMQAFARMLVMPAEMVAHLSSAGRNPTTMSLQFEVPEDDARQRLQELI